MESISIYNPTADESSRFMARTYLWMTFAMVLSAAAAYGVATSIALRNLFLAGGRFYIICVAEIAIVWILSLTLRKISHIAAVLMFMAYSLLNGVSMSSILLIYSGRSIFQCFFAAALMFLAMSVYGMKTRQSLARAGHYLMMALIGLIIVSAVNLIMSLVTGQTLLWIDWAISIATVIIFTGLTAYDTQKILTAARRADGSEAYKKLAVYGALELYIDFINIFLSLLRLFGRSRN